MSAIPQFTIQELLEAGVHFGHRTMRWNPKMAQYLFGSRNGTHIIDLQQTAPLLHQALKTVHEVVKNNGRVLFVGTKRQASEVIADSAKRCGQYYVNHRWLGGMLTNWNTVSASIKTLRNLEENIERNRDFLKKKEIIQLQRKADKLRLSLGGIMDMGGKPDLLFIIDTNKESLALKEAKDLNIPVIAILDSNSDPEGVDFPVPGNDDATRSIQLYCKLISDAVLSGIQESLSKSGIDIGSLDDINKIKAAANDAAKAKHKRPASKRAEVAIDEKDEDEQDKKKSPAKKPAAKKESKATVVEKKPAAKKTVKAKKEDSKE